MAVYVVGVWVRTWRWDFMLRPLKSVPVRRLFPVVVIGYMGNNVYPFRAGELLRAYVLREREGISISASLATVVVERVFDGLVMLAFVFVALPFSPAANGNPLVRATVIIASIAFFAALLLFFGLAARPRQTLALIAWICRRLPARLGEPLLSFSERFLDGLVSLRSFRNVLMIFGTSVIIWLLETVKYWFVMHAFSFDVSFFALMLMNGIVNLATTLPSAPGYVGTFDGPGILVLSEVYGVPVGTATAYTLVLHAALWFSMTFPGAWLMWRNGLGWASFQEAVDLADGDQPGHA